MDAYRSAFDQVVAFAAYPVLTVIGLLVAAALALRGQWRQGVLLGLEFWVAAGLVKLAGGTTWVALASAVAIIALRRMATWALARARTARAST